MTAINNGRSCFETVVSKTKTYLRTKMTTHYENENLLRKKKTLYENKLKLPLWTKVMFMRHTTKPKIRTQILNSEFDSSVIYYGISVQQ